MLKNFVIIIHMLIDRFLELVLEWCLKEKRTATALRENFFVSKSAIEIAEMIRKRELKCHQVVKAYIDRMKEVVVLK